MRGKGPKVSGFSLVELITILVLLGIVSIAVMTRFNFTPFQTAGFDQELRAAMRYAQKFAVTSGCDVQVQVDAGSDTYALRLRSDVTTPVSCLSATGGFSSPLNQPGAGPATGTAPAGVDITGGLTFFFDNRGAPSNPGSVIFSDGSAIIVEPVTGYVH